jgi:putative Mg2+ transporter-C (MgtC) family protein
LVTMVIGLERERYFKDFSKAKAAGFRTYTLVGLGSCLFAIASIYGFPSYIPSVGGTTVVDPGRIAAQVVTGVGFLGAGAIYFSGGHVKGLTTAAGLWVSAALGIMFGAGLIVFGLIAAVFAYLFLDFHRLFPRFFRKVTQIPADVAHEQLDEHAGDEHSKLP